MAHVNENYLKLPGNYLFATIAKKVEAYSKAHPEANIIPSRHRRRHPSPGIGHHRRHA